MIFFLVIKCCGDDFVLKFVNGIVVCLFLDYLY